MKGRGPKRGNRLPTGLEAEQEAFEVLTGNYLLYDSSSPLSHEIHFHPSSYQFDISTWMSDRQLQLTKYETGLLIFSTNLLFRQCLPSQHYHVLSCSDLHTLKIQLFLLSSHPHSNPFGCTLKISLSTALLQQVCHNCLCLTPILFHLGQCKHFLSFLSVSAFALSQSVLQTVTNV
uniref:Uncharacterized protein n=1 Tax=Pipistrellus kuhlii TaxID=59472 RepID=A0A7J7ZJC9_PIPKU|nr:hypothetical protein mPipKuh1_009484 [Pipistrellus kuhlii]